MEALNEVNELLTTKMCSPVIIFGIIIVISLFTIYFVRQKLMVYNTSKMENLYNLYSVQELKYLLILGIVMFGLCQYNKTELAWIFLIFPIIYVIIQNILLYIHVSSAIQNSPVQLVTTSQHYGLMNSDSGGGGGSVPPVITTPEKPVNNSGWELPQTTNKSLSLNNNNNNYFSNSNSQNNSDGPSGFNF